MAEGFSYGKFNNEGYKNLYDYEKNMSIDILLMGSSHMQAFQIMTEDNAANVLKTLSGKKIYNIGVGSHYLTTNANNLEAAVKKYKPSEFIIIETLTVSFTDDTLKQTLSGTLPKVGEPPKDTDAGAVISFYRKYLRGYLQKISRYSSALNMIINGALAYFKNYFDDYKSEREAIFTGPSNRILLSQLFSRMAATVRNNTSAKLIIVYHPEIKLNDDGSLSLTDNPEAVKIFSELCRENGIYFVNTGARFLDDYQKNHTLPYGFFNSSVGTGHMNKYGHRIFAEEVYKLIQEIERNN